MSENKGTANGTIAANIAALTAEVKDLRTQRDSLKEACAQLTEKLKEANVKIERDSRELMYPAIQEKFNINMVELDAMPLAEVTKLRESASRVAVATASVDGKNLNSVFVITASDAKKAGGFPDLYGKSPKQLQDMVSKL